MQKSVFIFILRTLTLTVCHAIAWGKTKENISQAFLNIWAHLFHYLFSQFSGSAQCFMGRVLPNKNPSQNGLLLSILITMPWSPRWCQPGISGGGRSSFALLKQELPWRDWTGLFLHKPAALETRGWSQQSLFKDQLELLDEDAALYCDDIFIET